MEDNTLDFNMDWDMEFGSWGEDLESDKKKEQRKHEETCYCRSRFKKENQK